MGVDWNCPAGQHDNRVMGLGCGRQREPEPLPCLVLFSRRRINRLRRQRLGELIWERAARVDCSSWMEDVQGEGLLKRGKHRSPATQLRRGCTRYTFVHA